MVKSTNQSAGFKRMEALAALIDSKFRVPGTQIRFGLDALIGLIPGAGDFSTFLISGYMIMHMSKNGASGFVVARMVFNVLLDTLIGSIPFVGDLFDVVFKANQRNVRLMRQHYIEGRHRGNAWKLIIPVLVIVLMLILGFFWLLIRMIDSLF
jgi:hypothetical protein